MSQPFVGEIRLVGFNFAPQGWAFCNGQLLPINQFDTLFNLIGTTYGGDGQSTFALPNLQSRVIVHQGQGLGLSNYIIGGNGGVETITVTPSQIPNHNHAAACSSSAGSQSSPVGNLWAADAAGLTAEYSNSQNGQVNAAAIGQSGGSQPHENRMPFLAMNYIISLFGVFPSQN
jgi:microcystin-dependent protein